MPPAAKPSKPSRQVLTALPHKSFAFLHAVGTSNAIRAALSKGAYTAKVHAEGWRLLDRASGRACTFVIAEPRANPSRDAYEELAVWEEKNLSRLRAAIVHHHPSYAKWLFSFTIGKARAAALVRVGVLLTRLDELETSPSRKATRDEDAAVLATLAGRGLDAAQRKSLVTMVAHAQAGPVAPTKEEPSSPADKSIDEAALLELHGWYTEWSTVARWTITRADFRERLGLRHRGERMPPRK